jgi:hypothetical protein
VLTRTLAFTAESRREPSTAADDCVSSKAVAADSDHRRARSRSNADAAGFPFDVQSRAFHRAGRCGTPVIVPAGEGTVHVDAVIAHVRGRVADFKLPQYVALRSKLLPRNPGRQGAQGLAARGDRLGRPAPLIERERLDGARSDRARPVGRARA